MNAFQKCINTSDVVPLYLPQQLYLKPIARISITVQLTQKMMGKTITHHELMTKLRELIKPDEFTLLKVTKTTLEIIRFEAEVEHKNKLNRIVSKLDNKMIKLKDFNELMRVRAAEAKLNFPKRHDWDSFFRDAKDMNESRPGERPDTIHIANLPIKWFVPQHLHDEEFLIPSEKILYCAFEKFGKLRNIDVPICDPYRSKMKSHMTGMQMSSFDDKDFFEGYIQFYDYIGFLKCMEALRGMKLLRKEEDENLTVNIYVDFDKSKHLCEGSIRRRDIVRDRLILKQKCKEDKEREIEEEKLKREKADRQKEIDIKNEKERRRREREEKRKAKILAELKGKGPDDISEKIAKEEKKLLKVQRRLEAIRLVEELFTRIKTKNENTTHKKYLENHRNDELSKMKLASESELKLQREKLHHAIESRVILKSIVSGQLKEDSDSSTSSESKLEIIDTQKPPEDLYLPGHHLYRYHQQYYNQPRMMGFMNRGRRFGGPPQYLMDIQKMALENNYSNWYGWQGYLPHQFPRLPYFSYRGRGAPGPSGRGNYTRKARSRSKSYSRSRSHSRNRSRSYNRSRTHSRSRSRYRSHSRSHHSLSPKRRRSNTRSHSRNKHISNRNRSRSIDKRSRTKNSRSRSLERKSRSRSRRRSRGSRKSRSLEGKSRSRTPRRKSTSDRRSRSRSVSREKRSKTKEK